MYKELITNKLRVMKIPYTIRGIEIQCTCLNPKHIDSHPSFSINSKTAFFNCFSCGFKGNFKNYLEGELDEDMERNTIYLEALRALEEEETYLDDEPASYEVALPPNSGITVEPFRGLSAETIASAGLYYCNLGRYAGRLIFPLSHGFDARIMAIDDTVPKVPTAKYLRPTTFKTAKQMYICKPKTYSDTVIICEGVLDALSYQELGFHAAANFGLQACSTDKAGALLAEGYAKVVNGFDPDAKGVQGWQNVKESWRQYFEIEKPLEIQRDLVRSGLGDINDYLINLKEINEDIHNSR